MFPNPPSEANGRDALVLNGEPLAISDVVTVAQGRPARLAPTCLERLHRARAAMLFTLENGKPVYGVTTGVGALRGIKVDTAEATHFNCLLILSHRVSHGDAVPHAVVRATMLCRAQGLSLGGAGMRPAVIEALIDTLNADEILTVHAIGSVGQADLVPLAEVAEALAARRLDEQIQHTMRVTAVELACAAQGIDLRKRSAALGTGTSALYRFVRSHIPALAAGDAPVTDLTELTAALDQLPA